MPLICLKHRREPRKLLKRIRTAVESGKYKKARWLIEEWLRSFAAKRLAVRLAYRAMPLHLRPIKSELDALAARLDPWKGSNEDVFVNWQAKEHQPDDYRLVMSFGIENRALQYLLLLVLRQTVKLHQSQYGLKGVHAAIKAVAKALREGKARATEFDIKDCYRSVQGEKLPGFLPVPSKVCRKVLTGEYLNVKGGSSLTDTFGSEDDDEWSPVLLNDELVKAQQGLPQGSAASPVIAEALLAPVIHLIPKVGVIIAYADNILLLAKDETAVASMSKTLRSALQAHPAGPFQPKVKHFNDKPIEFLGHRFTLLRGSVRIEPTPYNTAKFTKRMERRLQRLQTAKLTPQERVRRLRELRREVLSWTDGAFKLCTNIQTIRDDWLGQLAQLAVTDANLTLLDKPTTQPPHVTMSIK